MKSPYEPAPRVPAQVWRPFLQLFTLKLAITSGAAVLVYGVLRLLGPDPLASQKLASFLQQTSFAVAMLLITVAVPAFEEFCFRAPLRYTSFRLVAAFLAFGFLVLPSFLDLLGTSTLLSIMVVIGIIMLALAFLQSDSWPERMRQVWARHYGRMFYAFAIAAALAHLALYESLHLPVALIPLLVTLQFAGALFRGYLRLHFGPARAILAHGLFNALLLCLAFLTL